MRGTAMRFSHDQLTSRAMGRQPDRIAPQLFRQRSSPRRQASRGRFRPFKLREAGGSLGTRNLSGEVAPLEGKNGQGGRDDPDADEKTNVDQTQAVPQGIGGDVVVVGRGLPRELERVDERSE